MSIAAFERSCPPDAPIYTNTFHHYYNLPDEAALNIVYDYYMERYKHIKKNYYEESVYTHEDIGAFIQKHGHLFRQIKIDLLLKNTGDHGL